MSAISAINATINSGRWHGREPVRIHLHPDTVQKLMAELPLIESDVYRANMQTLMGIPVQVDDCSGADYAIVWSQ